MGRLPEPTPATTPGVEPSQPGDGGPGLGALHRHLFEDGLDAVVVADQAGIIRHANRAMCRLLGVPAGSLDGRPVKSIMAGQLLPYQPAWERFTRDGVQSGEVDLLRADGSTVLCGYDASSNVVPGMHVSIMRDISGRRQAEARRRELEEAARRVQHMDALSRLVGGMAHDLNNVLGTLLSSAELLALEASDADAVRELSARMVQATQRGRKLVQQVLAFSRRRAMARQRVRAEDLLARLDGSLRVRPPALPVLTRVDAATPDVMGDPEQLQDVQAQLVANALDASMATGAHILVTWEPAVISPGDHAHEAGLAPGRYARLVVADTGTGMDEAVRARVFEPFFTTSAEPARRGLGLPVVHGIVREHRGSVTLESAPGVGTTVTVLLPAADESVEVRPAPRPEPPPPALAAAGARRPRVLLVDDEEALALAMARVLERNGYDVATAHDAQDALARMRSGAFLPDLVITDLSMPGTPGHQFARETLRMRPGIPVVLVTGYDGEWTEDRLRGIGVSKVLHKPVATADLLLELERLLRPPADP